MDIEKLERILSDLQQNLEELAREDPAAIQPSLWLQLYQCHLLLHLERRLGVISWLVSDLSERSLPALKKERSQKVGRDEYNG